MSEHIVPTRLYVAVCATLLFFTGVTYWAALQDLGKFNIVVALAIATFKAVLVVLFFMHARYDLRRTQLVIIAGVVWLAIMLALTLSDYLSRSWLPVAG
ncbi:MAG TPA: cytochrome C oxidase subunit IV family protein [Candidatus Dormibacteraeota bacterium]|nr:cytochrome C oxidase subunit IV family protein [Candidatus Dormibacteraeota bacterium]